MRFGASERLCRCVQQADAARSRLGAGWSLFSTSLAIFTSGFVLRDFRRRHEHAPHRHMDVVGDVSATRGDRCPNRNTSGCSCLRCGRGRRATFSPARFEVRRQVEVETGVAVGMVSEMLAVDPEIGVHVDAVEAELDLAVGREAPPGSACDTSPCRRRPSRYPGRRAEFRVEGTDPRGGHARPPYGALAVRVGGAGGQILTLKSCGRSSVRQAASLNRGFGAGGVAEKKAPSFVEALFAPAGRDVRARRSRLESAPRHVPARLAASPPALRWPSARLCGAIPTGRPDRQLSRLSPSAA